MEYSGRRSRRTRRHPYANFAMAGHNYLPPRCEKPWSFLSGLFSFFIMTSLITIIYFMLEYHCSTCNNKCDLNDITKSINDITKNLSFMKASYYDLETKVSKFAQEIPKLEGQIEILETLTNTIEKSNFGWDPKTELSLPNVDVYRNQPVEYSVTKNVSKKCTKHSPKTVKILQE